MKHMKMLKTWTSQILKNKNNPHAATCHIRPPTAYELLKWRHTWRTWKLLNKVESNSTRSSGNTCHKTSLAAASSAFPLSRQMLSLPFHLTLKLLPVLLQKLLSVSSVPLQPQLSSMQDTLHLRCARSVWPTWCFNRSAQKARQNK